MAYNAKTNWAIDNVVLPADMNRIEQGIKDVDTGKAPLSHTHTIANITGLQSALDGKASSSHNHSISNITGLQSALDAKASSTHTHNLAVASSGGSGGSAGFMSAQEKEKLATIEAGAGAPTTIIDNLTSQNIGAALSANQGYVLKGLIDGKANSSHSHSISNVSGLQSALDGKEVYIIPKEGLRELEISREDFMDSIVTNSLIDLAVYEVEGGVDVEFIDRINKSGLLDGILLFVYEGGGRVSYHKEIDIFTTRRERLLNRQSLQPPFTVKFIKNRLDEILGERNYTLEIDYENSVIIVENTSTSQAWAEELFITINNVKPSSMLYINRPMDISNLYVNESIHMSQYLYNYRLGTRWVLGRKPFLSFEDKGEVKSLAVKSITPAMHHKVAQFIIGATTKVRINGSHIITTFTSKTVDENEANIIYDVAFGSVDNVTKIELMDDEDNVLSTTNLFIPIPDDTQIRHRIPVTSN